MKELAFNLFYFASAGRIDDFGLVVHELEGTDEEKTAFLQSRVEIDYKKCQRFRAYGPRNHSPLTIDAYTSLMRLGTDLEIFEAIFKRFDAPAAPICCVTPIIDGKPQIDIVKDHSPLRYSDPKHLAPGEDVIRDYLSEYFTSEGFDFPSLLNNDYFEAIKLLFEDRHYISCTKLLVSFIDTMAFLEYGDTQGNFQRWLRQFSDLERLNVTSGQLWEFRNSILHMSNLDSRKVLSGKEKRISFCVAKRRKSV